MGKRVDIAPGVYKVLHDPQDHVVSGTSIHIIGDPEENIYIQVDGKKTQLTRDQATSLAQSIFGLIHFFQEDYGYD